MTYTETDKNYWKEYFNILYELSVISSERDKLVEKVETLKNLHNYDGLENLQKEANKMAVRLTNCVIRLENAITHLSFRKINLDFN
jgi:phosphomevalonate kinase